MVRTSLSLKETLLVVENEKGYRADPQHRKSQLQDAAFHLDIVLCNPVVRSARAM